MADGDLTYRTVDLRPSDGTIRLSVVEGLDDEAEVRGDDTVVPNRAGQSAGDRVKDRRAIKLSGRVAAGDLATYRQIVDLLHTIFDPTLSAGPLVITGPHMGYPPGTTVTIQARFLNSVWGPVVGPFRKLSVELECITTPPDWVVA